MLENDEGNLEELRALYPSLTDEELRSACDNIRTYLKTLLRMAERVRRESRSINDV